MIINNLRKQYCGNITIFFSMTVLSILSLILVTTESIRINICENRLREISHTALSSCFSQYAKEVFDDYGIFMLYKNEEEIKNDYMTYVSKNINLNDKDSNSGYMNLFNINYDDSSLNNVFYVTDQNGNYFENQIGKYMEYRMKDKVFSEIYNQFDIFENSSFIVEIYEKINYYTTKFEKIENTVAKIKEDIDILKVTNGNPKDYLVQLRDLLNNYINIKKKYTDNTYYSNEDTNKLNSIFSEFKSVYQEYLENVKFVENTLKDIQEKTEIYKQSIEEVQESLKELKTQFDNKKGEIDEEYKQFIETEINEINNNFMSQTNDNYNVISNSQITNQNHNQILDANKILENTNKEITRIAQEELEREDIDDDFFYYSHKKINSAINCFNDFNLDNLYVNFNPIEVKGESQNCIDIIKNIISDGVSALVLDKNNNSQKELNTSELPSKTSNIKTGGNQSKEKMAVLTEYAKEKFNSYTSNVKENALDYELEYLIGGQDSDQKNIETVINKLLKIRQGFNLLFLMKDEQKKQEALVVATSIAGISGMPSLIKVTQLFVMSSWAYGESILDVKALLKGEKVSLIKSKEDWNLSLNNISNIANEQPKNNESGLTYSQYLSYLLLKTDSKLVDYRIMDLMQINIRQKYCENFRMSKGVVEINLKSGYCIKPLFTTFNFVKQQIRNKENKLQFNFDQKYSYK